MMLLKLTLFELRKRRNAIFGWGLGLAVYAMMIMAIAPELADQMSSFDLGSIPIYQAFGINEAIDSAASLLAVYLPLFGLMAAVYGAITGSNALAGEEDQGTLEMLLTLPVPRWVIVVSKALGIAIALMLIALLMFLGFAITYPSVEAAVGTELALGDFWIASAEMLPLALFFAMLTLFLGALLPRRGHALGVGLAILIGSYLFNNLGGTVQVLEDYLPLQPFYYYNGAAILKGTVDGLRIATLLIAAAICLALAVISFQRRNVTVGEWPWQRIKANAISGD